jgi:hypothetical protein
MKQYKIVKLKSGEDIIGTVRVGRDEKVKIFNPMIFKSMVQTDLFGGMKELFMLKNWLLLSDDKYAVISKDAINTIISASKDVSMLYEAEKEKQNSSTQPKTKAKKIPIDGLTGPAEELDPFDLIEKHIQDLLEKTDKMYEQDSNIKDLAKPKPNDKMVFMNMVFSPDVLVELLRSGILDRKEFGEIINEITNGNGEGMNPQKYTGNKKNKKDIGNSWTDWHPDPSSDDYK